MSKEVDTDLVDVVKVCASCGSTKVLAVGLLKWDEIEQDWYWAGKDYEEDGAHNLFFYQTQCMECGEKNNGEPENKDALED